MSGFDQKFSSSIGSWPYTGLEVDERTVLGPPVLSLVVKAPPIPISAVFGYDTPHTPPIPAVFTCEGRPNSTFH